MINLSNQILPASQNKPVWLKSNRILLPVVIGLILNLSVTANLYAQDCKESVSQLKLEIVDLEKQASESYQMLQRMKETDLSYKTVLGIYELNSTILQIKKDLLKGEEKNCLGPIPTSKADKNSTAVTDDEGQEMELSATLNVSKQGSRYLIRVDSNIAGGSLSLVATKKGSKSISFNVATDDAGAYALRTSRNLKGFVLTLKFNGEVLDKITVK
jgi:hypothetical protein